jgi:hypothetical protein
VLLAFPEIGPEAMAKLAHAAALQKDNPNWADEPRNPAGGPGGGEWTNDGNEGGRAEDANVRPAAAQISDDQAKKERFVDAHLGDTQAAADRLGIPVENILRVSALESRWGTSRFATQGNNFFGIHYPAPYASGYMQALNGPNKVAKFASYADSLRSFVAISGSIVQAKSDPEAFAAALQNSGRFGINQNGVKVPTYVPMSPEPSVGFARSSPRGGYEAGPPISLPCLRTDRQLDGHVSLCRSRNEDSMEDRRTSRAASRRGRRPRLCSGSGILRLRQP